ncbi:MAG: fatty acid desaturase [Acidobacteriia bacterium]|nr:fatty acid desaturase [Terriglobia bacterium]
MPSPIIVRRADVPQELKRELQRLMRPAPKAFFLQWFWAWMLVGTSVYAAVHFHQLWLSILVVLFVATRQNVLALLMHEQTHRLCSRQKWADFFCELLVAYPLLVTLEGYRRVHLSHHAAYFTDSDPDYLRKQGEEWTFPQQTAYFFRTLLRDLAGLNVFKTLKSKGMSETASAAKANFAPPRWLRPAFFGALFLLLTLTHTWTVYLIYWLLPLCTVMQLFIKWGAISEHKYNLIHPSVEESTPLIELRWWERLLLPNLNFTLHIYHHWYPTIPACHLPKVHQMFREASLVDDRYVYHGYGEFVRSLLGKTEWESTPLRATAGG